MGKYQQWVQLTMIVNEQKNKKKTTSTTAQTPELAY